jgi:hypothetical protein
MMSRCFAVALLLLTSCVMARTSPAGPEAEAALHVPGKSYFGSNGYIEYVAGNAPVILTAPHGGSLAPSTIPDRIAANCGGVATTGTDQNTVELVRAMQERYHARFGTYPHVVIAHIARRKLDANRTAPEAASGNPEAERALGEWHHFIDIAKTSVLESRGRGWYMDIHGHRHAAQRLELGYLLTPAQVNLPDSTLDQVDAFEDTVSIRTISEMNPAPLSVMLRGAKSLGTLYSENGFPSVPSSTIPRPGSDLYFAGGDNTRRHTCGAEAKPLGGVTGGAVCGVQIEANFTGVRDTPANRTRFGEVTAVVLEEYLQAHWNFSLRAAAGTQ